jgi:hypothetical protein
MPDKRPHIFMRFVEPGAWDVYACHIGKPDRYIGMVNCCRGQWISNRQGAPGGHSFHTLASARVYFVEWLDNQVLNDVDLWEVPDAR